MFHELIYEFRYTRVPDVQVTKVTLKNGFSSFGCFPVLCRSRIRAHNKLTEAEKLLVLSQHIFLYTIVYQFSSSNLH